MIKHALVVKKKIEAWSGDVLLITDKSDIFVIVPAENVNKPAKEPRVETKTVANSKFEQIKNLFLSGKTIKEVSTAVGLSKSSVLKYRSRLVSMGLLKGRKNGIWYKSEETQARAIQRGKLLAEFNRNNSR